MFHVSSLYPRHCGRECSPFPQHLGSGSMSDIIKQKGLHCVQGKEQGGERYQVSHYTLVSGCIYRVQSVQVITASTTALLVHVHGHVLHMRDLIRSFVTTNTCTVPIICYSIPMRQPHAEDIAGYHNNSFPCNNKWHLHSW